MTCTRTFRLCPATISSHRSRRCMSAFLASVLLVAGSGLPLPVPVRKDTGTPFPCQSRGCSCADAQTCWSECRCQTLDEKLAWSFETGVAPPPKFAAQFAVYSASRRSCRKPTAAVATNSSPRRSCCAKPVDGKTKNSTETTAGESSESRMTVLLEVARCRGVAIGVHSLSEALPFECEPFVERLPPGEWIVMPAEFGCDNRTEPLEPPPRLRYAA